MGIKFSYRNDETGLKKEYYITLYSGKLKVTDTDFGYINKLFSCVLNLS